MSGLYIHIPFCHGKCFYCDFFSTVNRRQVDDYIDMLSREYLERKAEIPQPVTTIYIGGGTPSSLSHPQLRRLFEMLPIGPDIEEFTIELNPEDVNGELIGLLKEYGVNRVSMGIQSLCDSELRSIGRRHTAGTAIQAATLLQRSFANTSFDLMFGLPGQTLDSWKHSVEGILALRPAHISAYSLMLEENTLLYRRVKKGEVLIPSQETNSEMYQVLCDSLATAGYRHYEISNFALPGFESLHNSNYWNFTPYVGLGASAHSFDGNGIRKANSSSLSQYLTGWKNGRSIEVLSEYDSMVEWIMLGLRHYRGVNIAEFESRFGIEKSAEIQKAARPQIDAGYLELNDGTLHIPEKHWLITDNIIISLL